MAPRVARRARVPKAVRFTAGTAGDAPIGILENQINNYAVGVPLTPQENLLIPPLNPVAILAVIPPSILQNILPVLPIIIANQAQNAQNTRFHFSIV